MGRRQRRGRAEIVRGRSLRRATRPFEVTPIQSAAAAAMAIGPMPFSAGGAFSLRRSRLRRPEIKQLAFVADVHSKASGSRKDPLSFSAPMRER